MAEYGGEAGGCVGFCCYGILGQFCSTRTYGTNWTCWDKCCRCESCWDNGEFDPEDRPGAGKGASTQAADATGIDAPPPAYKAADPMTVPAQTEAVPSVPTTTPAQPAEVTHAP